MWTFLTVMAVMAFIFFSFEAICVTVFLILITGGMIAIIPLFAIYRMLQLFRVIKRDLEDY